jgi:hypothetical protein
LQQDELPSNEIRICLLTKAMNSYVLVESAISNIPVEMAYQSRTVENFLLT